jgi:hypothetical protein
VFSRFSAAGASHRRRWGSSQFEEYTPKGKADY